MAKNEKSGKKVASIASRESLKSSSSNIPSPLVGEGCKVLTSKASLDDAG